MHWQSFALDRSAFGDLMDCLTRQAVEPNHAEVAVDWTRRIRAIVEIVSFLGFDVLGKPVGYRPYSEWFARVVGRENSSHLRLEAQSDRIDLRGRRFDCHSMEAKHLWEPGFLA